MENLWLIAQCLIFGTSGYYIGHYLIPDAYQKYYLKQTN